MFRYYREFNLERSLIGDMSIYPLNNNNSGLISIFEDKMYSTSLKKMNHLEEMKYHLLKYGYNVGDKIKVLSVFNDYNVVIIKIYKKTLIIQVPNNLNSFQKENLLSVLEEVRIIDEVSGMSIEVYLDGLEQNDEYFIDAYNVMNFVKSIKVNSK